MLPNLHSLEMLDESARLAIDIYDPMPIQLSHSTPASATNDHQQQHQNLVYHQQQQQQHQSHYHRYQPVSFNHHYHGYAPMINHQTLQLQQPQLFNNYLVDSDNCSDYDAGGAWSLRMWPSPNRQSSMRFHVNQYQPRSPSKYSPSTPNNHNQQSRESQNHITNNSNTYPNRQHHSSHDPNNLHNGSNNQRYVPTTANSRQQVLRHSVSPASKSTTTAMSFNSPRGGVSCQINPRFVQHNSQQQQQPPIRLTPSGKFESGLEYNLEKSQSPKCQSENHRPSEPADKLQLSNQKQQQHQSQQPQQQQQSPHKRNNRNHYHGRGNRNSNSGSNNNANNNNNTKSDDDNQKQQHQRNPQQFSNSGKARANNKPRQFKPRSYFCKRNGSGSSSNNNNTSSNNEDAN